MRLLNTDTLDFEVFLGDTKPEYLILSHTWGSDEITYQDMCWLKKLRSFTAELKSNPLFPLIVGASSGGTNLPLTENEITRRDGYLKIKETSHIARRKGYDYFWVDTCCIDKTSSSELQEAINSMYRWYEESSWCVVYLEDADSQTSAVVNESEHFEEVLSKSKWITRGWTLQELIAPQTIAFHDKKWQRITTKARDLEAIAYVTRIPVEVLASRQVEDSSIAQRMSWAAGRSTTRVEDLAYSLMGIFDIQMPLLYGEGKKAFIRLQEEILKHSNDDSIFAWKALEGNFTTYRGLLARSPSEFLDSHDIGRGQGPGVDVTSLGLRTTSLLTLFNEEKQLFKMMLQARKLNTSRLWIFLKKLTDDDQYVRVSPSCLFTSTQRDVENFNKWYTIRVRQKIQIPRTFRDRNFHTIFCRCALRLPGESRMVIGDVWPPSKWNVETQEIVFPETNQDLACLIRVNFYPEIYREEHVDARIYPTVDVVFGSRQSPSGWWCKILRKPFQEWPPDLTCVSLASDAYNRTMYLETIEDDDWQHKLSNGRFGVSIEPALHNDKICLFVNFDGLR